MLLLRGWNQLTRRREEEVVCQDAKSKERLLVDKYVVKLIENQRESVYNFNHFNRVDLVTSLHDSVGPLHPLPSPLSMQL